MTETSDPRVFFAAERTLLAWIRTGLTIMAFGFVIARFGLFLTLLRIQQDTRPLADNLSGWSNLLGLSLVMLGDACIFTSVYQHRKYIRTIPKRDMPEYYLPSAALALATAIGLAGLGVAAYLFLINR